MNKKLLLSSLAALSVAGLSAKHLTPQEALSRAISQPVSGMSKAPAASSMEIKRILLNPDDQATLYVFAGEGNAIIVPADDRVAPVLGYIDGCAEGQIPPQMEWWLLEYSSQIDYLLARPEGATGLRISMQPNAAADSKAPIAPMVTTRWNQESPYNYDCPVVNGRKSVTGCVATAAAQVMKYHNYPPVGQGTISYLDDDNNVTRTLDLDGKPFDWDNMIDNYALTYNATQRDAVAFLMKAVGFASKMGYSPEVSGAQSEDMVSGVKKYFGYNQKTEMLYRTNYTLADWENIIYENLEKVGPVYYAGTDGQGGHAFVCDGYSNDGFFHFNWGWGGAYDGYFKLCALNPEGQGIGGNVGGFNLNQRIVVNFTTPDGATIDLPALSPITLTGNMTAQQDGSYGLAISSDMAESMGICAYNITSETVKVEFGLKAVNVSTGEETIEGYGSPVTLASHYGREMLFLDVPGDLPDGSYRMYLVTRNYPSGEWLPVRHDLWNVDYVNVTMSGGAIKMVSNVSGGEIEAYDLNILSPVHIGYAVKLTYTLENNYTTEIYDALTPYVFTYTNGKLSTKAIGEAQIINLGSNESTEIEVTPTLYALQGTSSFTGSAYLGIVSGNTGMVLDYVPVTVEAAPASLSVTATQFSMNGDRLAADANNLEFNCGLTVDKGYWAAPLTVYISTLTGNGLHYISSADTYFLDAGESASTTVSGSFPAAVEGQKYQAIFGYISGNYVQSLASLIFKVSTSYSGIEEVTDGSADATTVTVDRVTGRVLVTADTDIASVEAYTLDGRNLPLDMTVEGTVAEAPLSSLPAGIALVKVTLTDATTTVAKVVR